MTRLVRRAISVAVLSLWLATPTDAIVLYSKTYRNKSAPTGSYANSGWQWQGEWGQFLGTPIGKNHFITASHIGGSVGQSLKLNGKTYKTTAFYDDPSTDLRIWKVSTAFTSWAPIYTGRSEAGKHAMIFGRGSQRGAEVKLGSSRKGWLWGAMDHLRSWGRNRVDGARNMGNGLGDGLYFDFDRVGISEEGTLTGGDSAGGLFIKDGTVWKLAGIHYAVEASFRASQNGSSFNAAIYDKGGLWYGGKLIGDTSTDIPALAYSTRVSTRSTWINDVIAGRIAPNGGAARPEPTVVPEPGAVGLLSATALLTLGRRSRRSHR